MQGILWNLVIEAALPVLVEVVGHAVINSLRTRRVRKHLHRPRPSSMLAEGSLQHARRADLFPQLRRKGVVVQQVIEIFLQTAPARPRLASASTKRGIAGRPQISKGPRKWPCIRSSLDCADGSWVVRV